MMLFNHLNDDQFHDFLFIVTPKFMKKYAILWDSIRYEYVSIDNANDKIDNLLTIDEAIDQDFLGKKEYAEILINLNVNHINSLVPDSFVRRSLIDTVVNRINEMTSFYGDVHKLDIMGI